MPIGHRGLRDRAWRIDPALRIGIQDFGRRDAFVQRGKARERRLGQMQLAAGERKPGQPQGLFVAIDGEQNVVGFLGEQGRVGQGARRDHAHHLAFDRAFARGRVADLFADRDRFAELDQARQIAFERDHRHAGHAHRHAGRLPTCRERDADQARGLVGVVVEQLVKIAHAVEHQHVRVLGLDRQVLAHHGRVLGGLAGAVAHDGRAGKTAGIQPSAITETNCAKTFGLPATTSPESKWVCSPPQSPIRPPASSTSRLPAAMSQGLRLASQKPS